MNESLLSIAYLQLAQNLAAIRKSGSFRRTHDDFDEYVRDRWSLSKSRAKLLINYSKLVAMCQDAEVIAPDSPDNVAPILRLAQKRWLEVWSLCLDCIGGRVNASGCEAVMERFGFYRKRLPDHVLKKRKVTKAINTLADLEDGEKAVDELGNLGNRFEKAVEVVIDADQRIRST